jgi:hypothetical protein
MFRGFSTVPSYAQSEERQKNPQYYERAATREQIVRLHADYKALAGTNDPRTCDLLRQAPFGADRDGRIEWAKHFLGIQSLESFNDLSAAQAGYLLDILSGKPTKLDDELDRQWQRIQVRQPEKYFEAMQQKSSRFKFGGRGLGQLNRWQKWKLVTELKTRRAGHSEGF